MFYLPSNSRRDIIVSLKRQAAGCEKKKKRHCKCHDYPRGGGPWTCPARYKSLFLSAAESAITQFCITSFPLSFLLWNSYLGFLENTIQCFHTEWEKNWSTIVSLLWSGISNSILWTDVFLTVDEVTVSITDRLFLEMQFQSLQCAYACTTLCV